MRQSASRSGGRMSFQRCQSTLTICRGMWPALTPSRRSCQHRNPYWPWKLPAQLKTPFLRVSQDLSGISPPASNPTEKHGHPPFPAAAHTKAYLYQEVYQEGVLLFNLLTINNQLKTTLLFLFHRRNGHMEMT